MTVDDLLGRLDQPGADALSMLRAARGDETSKALWRSDTRLYVKFAWALIRSGNPTRAFELVREGLAAHPNDQDLEYLGALALRRGGNIQRAGEYVEKLLRRTDLTPETELVGVSLVGALLKERYLRSLTSREDPELARGSARAYARALAIAQDPARFPHRDRELFPGVNAATMAFVAGDLPDARRWAEAVNDRVLVDLADAKNAGDYWLLATLGEVKLLLGELPEAAHGYRRAIEMAKARGREGDIESMRRNFQILRAKIPLSEEIWGFFNVGNVVAFAGHKIDHPARPTRVDLPCRFPPNPALIARVGEEIGRQIEALNARVGYCSASSGADILFAERMLDRGAELHIVLPFDLGDFYRTSVDYGVVDHEMASWRARCERVLRLATQVHDATTERHLGDDVLFDFANTFIHGLAILRAAERGVDPFALVVLDPELSQARHPGSTVDFLDKCRARGLETRLIDLGALRRETGTPPGRPTPATPQSPADARVRRKTMVMLFADVKNFSKLDDDRYPDFFARFLDEVKGVIDASNPPPAFVNTWGDGLYVVFEGVVAGSDFALRLVECVGAIDWKALGLPEDTTVRIGVHAGPVYQRLDPILGRENVFGSQVNRAARIEPVTTPGCVFASEQFAAAIAAEAGHDFTCEYVGIEELAKGYDRCPLYLLRRR